MNATGKTLNAWPDIPFKLVIADDLYLDIYEYGEYIAPDRQSEFGEALNWIISEIDDEGDDPADFIRKLYYRFVWVTVWFHNIDWRSGKPAEISRANAAKILKAIDGVVFAYNYGARELSASIFVTNVRVGGLHIGFHFEGF